MILLITGNNNLKSWNASETKSDFYHIKGYVDSFIKKISLDNVLIDSYYSSVNEIYAYYYTKSSKNVVIGIGGKINSEVLKKFDIHQDVYCFEFDLTLIRLLEFKPKHYKEPLKYPKVVRDFAFIFDKTVRYLDVKNFILNKSSDLLKDVKVFDVFENEALGIDKKSIAFTLEFFDENRTLTEDEVEKDFSNLIKLISKEFNAKLRGN